jgi:hypothetical protein
MDLIKIRYPKIIKLIISFDPRKSLSKTKYNQIQLHPYGLIIEIDPKKSAIDYSKIIEICNVDDIILNNDTSYEIIITLYDGKN